MTSAAVRGDHRGHLIEAGNETGISVHEFAQPFQPLVDLAGPRHDIALERFLARAAGLELHLQHLRPLQIHVGAELGEFGGDPQIPLEQGLL